MTSIIDSNHHFGIEESRSDFGEQKKIAESTQAALLAACRRRCCLCVFLENDEAEKSGQIAHIDRNSSNNTISNLAWLCLNHHDRYDSKTSQSKGLLADELKKYKAALEEKYIGQRLLSPADRLRVRFRPEWIGVHFGLQVAIESRVEYPIKISAIDVVTKWRGKQSSHRLALPCGPVVIGPLGDLHFSVELARIRPKEIVSVSLTNSDGVVFGLDPKQAELIRSFQPEFDKVQRVWKNEAAKTSITIQEGDFAAACSAELIGSDPFLRIRLESRCGYPVTIVGYKMLWRSKLQESGEDDSEGGPRVRQVGSEIGSGLPSLVIPSMGWVDIDIKDFIVSYARECEVHSESIDQICVDFILDEGWVISISDDGLPEALHQIFVAALRNRSGLV